VKSVIDQIDDFMLSKNSIVWIEDNILKIYVRKNFRYINHQQVNTFDIANIKTISKRYQGKGYFKAFMLKVESLGIPVYVECIHNPKLIDMLEKNGYTILGGQYDTNAIKFPC
jgi:EAL domain-containing protein (putative c-di-GMP-specific phosphodiesterase class I)